ncbi:hypothetical protein C8F04DRAFT_1185156 [Mycena alexandri]|uniref:Uncharacterized protein n=1 Tax=Mycena alexandri TaxID=1745969 RepID=A0AAD6SRC2_9AGAR|nr:hypothetical protein C8F04DRAFT_1185156 [Mycena alexandri]
MVEPKHEPTPEFAEVAAIEEELNLQERELKRELGTEVIKIGPLGPISAAARAYLEHYMKKPVLEEKTVAERLRELEPKGGVPYLMALRETGIARAAAEKARIKEVREESERRRLERLKKPDEKEVGKG